MPRSPWCDRKEFLFCQGLNQTVLPHEEDIIKSYMHSSSVFDNEMLVGFSNDKTV